MGFCHLALANASNSWSNVHLQKLCNARRLWRRLGFLRQLYRRDGTAHALVRLHIVQNLSKQVQNRWKSEKLWTLSAVLYEQVGGWDIETKAKVIFDMKSRNQDVLQQIVHAPDIWHHRYLEKGSTMSLVLHLEAKHHHVTWERTERPRSFNDGIWPGSIGRKGGKWSKGWSGCLIT